MMKTGEAERYIKEQLKNLYSEAEATNIAGLLLEQLTDYQKAERLNQKEQPLSPVQSERLHASLVRLREHEPIQYVINTCWFYGMKLYVDPAVLIPRPETEELVEWIAQDVKASAPDVFFAKPGAADETSRLKIMDVGTGSGCIALALKKTMPRAEVWGCDSSDAALNVARRNGSALNIRVDFQGLDFLDEAQQRQLPTVDIIVSNPPYVPSNNKAGMDPNVVRYEPHAALFVPDADPLVFYKALAVFGKKRLYTNGSIYMEIHEDLGKDVLELFQIEGYLKTELRKDMQGKDRMVKAMR